MNFSLKLFLIMFTIIAIESGCTSGRGELPTMAPPPTIGTEFSQDDNVDSSHADPAVAPDLGDPRVIAYHWLALKAIDNNDEQAAIHHVNHVLELVTGSHRSQMMMTLSDLRDGRTHKAGHQIKEMLAGTADPILSAYRMHLELALYSLEKSQVVDAQHHFEHLINDGPGPMALTVENAMAAIAEGKFAAARASIEQLLAESVDTDVPGGCADLTHEPPETSEVVIVLLADEEWIEEQGGKAAADFYLRRLASVAASSLAEIGISLLVSEYGSYSAQSDLWLYTVAAGGEVDLSVFFAGRELPGTVDARLDRSGRRIVIENKNGDIRAEALLLVHEIGHFLGLSHRAGTFMQPHGFPLVGVWSLCQRDFMDQLNQQSSSVGK